MLCLCFHGKYKYEHDKEEKKKQSQDDEFDIYDLILSGMRVGIAYDDFHDMDYVTLINILETYYRSISKQKNKSKYREATQQDIDMII